MRRRDGQDRLRDILSAAEDTRNFTAGLDTEAFAALPDTDRHTFRALKNALTKIGEAVKLLPPELLARHPDVDWRGWAGLRDVISHRYFDVETTLLRPTVVEELPILIAAARTELEA